MHINIGSQLKPPLYDPEAVQPMRDELLYVGFQELRTPQQAEEILSLKDDKTTFLVINSVCGCAAGSARPAATRALQNAIIPDRFVTAFAGMDRDAVDLIRQRYMPTIPPSSPSMALFKNGEILFVLPRHHIEGRTPEEIADLLTHVFNEHCNNQGPSISPEKYAELEHAKMCGSKIPLNNQ